MNETPEVLVDGVLRAEELICFVTQMGMVHMRKSAVSLDQLLGGEASSLSHRT